MPEAMVMPIERVAVEATPKRKRTWGRKLARYLPSVVLVVILLIGWQIAIRAFDVQKFVFPAPTDVVTSLKENSDALSSAAWVTAKEILFGFLIALVTGVLLAVTIHLIP